MVTAEGIRYVVSTAAACVAVGGFTLWMARNYAGTIRTWLSGEPDPVCPTCDGVGHVQVTSWEGTLTGERKRCPACSGVPVHVPAELLHGN